MPSQPAWWLFLLWVQSQHRESLPSPCFSITGDPSVSENTPENVLNSRIQPAGPDGCIMYDMKNEINELKNTIGKLVDVMKVENRVVNMD